MSRYNSTLLWKQCSQCSPLPPVTPLLLLPSLPPCQKPPPPWSLFIISLGCCLLKMIAGTISHWDPGQLGWWEKENRETRLRCRAMRVCGGKKNHLKEASFFLSCLVFLSVDPFHLAYLCHSLYLEQNTIQNDNYLHVLQLCQLAAHPTFHVQIITVMTACSLQLKSPRCPFFPFIAKSFSMLLLWGMYLATAPCIWQPRGTCLTLRCKLEGTHILF